MPTRAAKCTRIQEHECALHDPAEIRPSRQVHQACGSRPGKTPVRDSDDRLPRPPTPTVVAMTYAGDLTPTEAWELLDATPTPSSSTCVRRRSGCSSASPTSRAWARSWSWSPGTTGWGHPATRGSSTSRRRGSPEAGPCCSSAGQVPARRQPPPPRPARASHPLTTSPRVRGIPDDEGHRGATGWRAGLRGGGPERSLRRRTETGWRPDTLAVRGGMYRSQFEETPRRSS